MEVMVATGVNAHFLTGWMPFLSPNQQCQSTEGKTSVICIRNKILQVAVLNLQCSQPDSRAFCTRRKCSPSLRESHFTWQVVKHQCASGVLQPQVTVLTS